MAAPAAADWIMSGPVIFDGNAGAEIDAPVNQIRRRVHVLEFFSQFGIGWIEGGDGFSAFDRYLHPLFQRDDTLFVFFHMIRLFGR